MLCNIYESQPVKYYLWWFSPKYFLSKLRQNEFIWRVVWLRKNKDDCNAKFADSKLQTLIFACFQLKIEKVLLQDWLVFKCKILMFIRTEWCINILYRKFQPKSIIGSPLKQLEEGISCFFCNFYFSLKIVSLTIQLLVIKTFESKALLHAILVKAFVCLVQK